MHPLHDTGNIARLSNDPIVGLPAAANWPIRPWPAKVEITPLRYTTPRDTIDDLRPRQKTA
jgi:hypothetical protein